MNLSVKLQIKVKNIHQYLNVLNFELLNKFGILGSQVVERILHLRILRNPRNFDICVMECFISLMRTLDTIINCKCPIS
jgi:hypothetical protein